MEPIYGLTPFPDTTFSLTLRIEFRIDEMGMRLTSFLHHRLTGSNRYRMRVGDYRIIYTFAAAANTLHLLAVGHRRETYRDL